MSRLIDADLLKAGFEEDGHLSPYIEGFIDACPTVDPVKRSKWISVKDRLPEEGNADDPHWVLAVVKSTNEDPDIFPCYLVDGEWGGFGDQVTHWMEMADLLKEVEDE